MLLERMNSPFPHHPCKFLLAQFCERIRDGDVNVVVVSTGLERTVHQGSYLLISAGGKIGSGQDRVGALAVRLTINGSLGELDGLVIFFLPRGVGAGGQHFGKTRFERQRTLAGGQPLFDPAGTVASRAAALGRELVTIGQGRSEVAPAKGDKRFSDPAWRGNPLLKRTMQAYLATTDTVYQLLSDAELEWRDAERMKFVLDVLTEGLSPSNNPLLSPLGYKALIDTGGLSALRGLRHFAADMASAPRVPSMVEPDAFTLGQTIAATPGSVILRTEQFELIQYTPQTDTVYRVPLLMVPPVINKFYVLDLAPGRSMIEHFVRQGLQVFAISWRNPTADQRNWGFDTYGQAILNALEAVEKITETDRTHLQASCSGGILAAMTAAHLNAIGEGHRLAGLTLMVTVLDERKAGFPAAAIDEEVAKLAIASSARKGYLDGRSLAEVFAWLLLDRADALGRAVAGLPPGQRHAVTLFYYADQPATGVRALPPRPTPACTRPAAGCAGASPRTAPTSSPPPPRRTPMTAVRIAHADPWPRTPGRTGECPSARCSWCSPTTPGTGRCRSGCPAARAGSGACSRRPG